MIEPRKPEPSQRPKPDPERRYGFNTLTVLAVVRYSPGATARELHSFVGGGDVHGSLLRLERAGLVVRDATTRPATWRAVE